MKNAKKRLVVPVLALGAAVGWQAAGRLSAHADDQKPKTSVSVTDLAKMRGPKPPQNATFVGTEAQPTVGDVGLPLQNAQVYQFTVKTKDGKTLPVKWSYQAGTGTFLWTTAPIECGDGSTIARGGFVMKIREDGSGSYALGTKQCPTSAIYGCGFDSKGKETDCGACAWNQSELVCTDDDD